MLFCVLCVCVCVCVNVYCTTATGWLPNCSYQILGYHIALLSRNPEASTFWNPQVLPRAVMGFLYIFTSREKTLRRYSQDTRMGGNYSHSKCGGEGKCFWNKSNPALESRVAHFEWVPPEGVQHHNLFWPICFILKMRTHKTQNITRACYTSLSLSHTHTLSLTLTHTLSLTLSLSLCLCISLAAFTSVCPFYVIPITTDTLCCCSQILRICKVGYFRCCLRSKKWTPVWLPHLPFVCCYIVLNGIKIFMVFL